MDPINSIPMELRQPGEAAVRWLNEKNNDSFYLTGIVDYESALNTETGQDYEFGLILCNGEICVREQVTVFPQKDGYKFNLSDRLIPDIPPLLDPPEGIRSTWLTNVLRKHDFVVLLFYRGLW
jgi:hypothetical protein